VYEGNRLRADKVGLLFENGRLRRENQALLVEVGVMQRTKKDSEKNEYDQKRTIAQLKNEIVKLKVNYDMGAY